MNTCIQLIRVPDIQIHSFSAGEVCMYLYFTFASSTPLTTHWNVFLTLTNINVTLSNKRHTHILKLHKPLEQHSVFEQCITKFQIPAYTFSQVARWVCKVMFNPTTIVTTLYVYTGDKYW